MLTGYYWVLTGYYWVLTGYYRVLTGYYGVLTGYYCGTHGVLWGYSQGTMGYSKGTMGALKYSASGLKEALDAAHGWMRPASLCGLERGREGVEGVLWVLHRPLEVLIGYSRRAPLCAWTICRSRPRAGLTCGQRAHMRRVLRDSECGCSHPDHPSANRHPDHAVNVCAGRCSPVAAAVGRAGALGRPSIGGRPTRPRRSRAASPMAS